MFVKITRRQLLWGLPLTAAVSMAGIAAAVMLQPPPSNLDLSLSKATEHGFYLATLSSGRLPVPVGAIHTWIVKVTTPDGEPVKHTAITIDGGMPQHGHGLPTQPKVTTDLGDGDHLIEGMKFNMGGWWTLTVSIDGPTGSDKATFNIVL